MGAEGATSVAAMVDAQLNTVRVLKPFDNFERVYQGKNALAPIAFPGTRDKRAEEGAPGFDPNLLRGIPVPQGARVLLWLPMCFSPVPPGNVLDPFQLYSYRLVWRYQNLTGYRNPSALTKRAPYHFARQSPGAPDTSVLSAGVPRVTLPASWHVVAYSQTEPAGGLSGQLNLHVEDITPRLDSLTQFVQPFLPDGSAGVVEQGVADPASVSGALMPIFMPFWTDAEGDELIIFANRTGATANDTWDFTDATKDLAFSNIYGTGNGTHAVFRDIGIYMQTGTTP
jgi:hypothetical protein